MRVRDGDIELDATFSLAATGDGQVILTVESRGGTRGAPNSRNMDYDRGLEVLLERLAARGAVVMDALVVSRAALRDFPDAVDRRLDVEGGYPIRLGGSEPSQIRRAFGRAQRVTARDPSLTSSGNNNKRIGLWLNVPGEVDPAALARELGDPAPSDRPAASASRGRRPRRQGYMTDAVRKRAIEDRAMDEATEHYKRQGFDVEDVSGTNPFDLLCTRSNGQEKHVEVKGTTGAGDAVELTIGEVRHARSRRGHIALFILHSIVLRDGSPGPTASGGESIVIDPWDADGGTLEPTRFIWSPRK